MEISQLDREKVRNDIKISSSTFGLTSQGNSQVRLLDILKCPIEAFKHLKTFLNFNLWKLELALTTEIPKRSTQKPPFQYRGWKGSCFRSVHNNNLFV